jgi:hypothetical protein
MRFTSFTFVLLLCFSTIHATECTVNKTCPGISPYRWIPNKELKIFYQANHFSMRERAGLQQAIQNWQLVLPQTKSGITIREAGEVSQSIDCEECILVKRDPQMPKGHYGELRPIKGKDGYYTAAIVAIKSDIHNPELLSQTLQHELGHAFGLLDCITCKSESSVMNYYRKVSVFGIGISGISTKPSKAPTACDIQLIASGYVSKPVSSTTINLGSPHDLNSANQQVEERETEADLDTTAPEEGIGKELVGVANKNAKPLSPEERSLINELLAKETENFSALNNYTFKRDILIQTIDKDGKVSGEYHRVSDIVFDDAGNRVEKIISFPSPTLKNLVISKEDLSDFSGVQMLGVESSKMDRYHITPLGNDKFDGNKYRIFKIVPVDLNQAKIKGERVFYGNIWTDSKASHIVKLRGKGLPEGKQRFPTFETKRTLIDGKYWFPSHTWADEILVFPNTKIRMRVSIRYTNYKRFRSELRIIDEDSVQLRP